MTDETSEVPGLENVRREVRRVRPTALVHGSVNEGRLIFDERPIEIGGFALLAHEALPTGTPSMDGWQAAFEFAGAAQVAAPYWIGDLLNYAETRVGWREQLSQMQSVTHLSEGTLHNLAYLSRHVRGKVRALAPTPSHAFEVAKFDPVEQQRWMEKARDEGWNHRELRLQIRAARRRGVIEGQQGLSGKYRVVYADPPWQYNDAGPITSSDSYGRAESHYGTMSVEEIVEIPVKDHVASAAVLFLWCTEPMRFAAKPVIDAWGFTHKSAIVWDKVAHNFGHYVSVRHEHLLICTLGSCTPDRPTPMPDSVVTVRRPDVHSQKPEEFRTLIERMYDGPYLELFARRHREGWTCWGNQISSDVVAMQ